MTSSAYSAPSRGKVGPPALWFGMFGAPFAWSIQELVGYAVVAHGCYPSSEPKLSVRMPELWIIDLLITAVTLVIGILAALAAYRAWVQIRQVAASEIQHQLEHGEGRTRFMAVSGIVLSLVFLFGIAMNAVAILLQPVCS